MATIWTIVIRRDWKHLALGFFLAISLFVGLDAGAFASVVSVQVPEGDDICKLLTKKQVVKILGVSGVGPAIPGNDECIWQRRPTPGRPLVTARLTAESLDDATRGYPDYLTALQEGTTAEYSPVSELGDEAYAGRSVLAPADSVDGVNVVEGDVVLDLDWTSKPAQVGSRRYDAIISSLRKALRKL
jgi:hypothetical protein